MAPPYWWNRHFASNFRAFYPPSIYSSALHCIGSLLYVLRTLSGFTLFDAVSVLSVWFVPFSFPAPVAVNFKKCAIMHQNVPVWKDKKLRWCWQTRATRLEVSQLVKVTKHGTIPCYVWFPLCYSNFVPKTRRFSDIRHQKMSWHWNPGHRSLKLIESGIIR